MSDFSSLPPKLLLPKVSSREAKKKKVIFWGIEVPETLSWRGWELGKEIIRHLTLKNVHGKAQKLNYRCVGSLFVLCTPHALAASSLLLLYQSPQHLFSDSPSLSPLECCAGENVCTLMLQDRNLLIQKHTALVPGRSLLNEMPCLNSVLLILLSVRHFQSSEILIVNVCQPVTSVT